MDRATFDRLWMRAKQEPAWVPMSPSVIRSIEVLHDAQVDTALAEGEPVETV